VESYGSRVRDELLAIEQFDTCSKPRSLSPTGASSTTITVRTLPLGCRPRPSSPEPAGPTHPNSH